MSHSISRRTFAARLQRRVVAFGFWLAELEIRQHAGRHAAAAAELLGLAGIHGYLAMGEDERLRVLEERLASGLTFDVPGEALSPETREVLETFQAMGDVQRLNGQRGAQTYVVSMSRAPSDALVVLLLAREAGLLQGEACRLDVVPLFETIVFVTSTLVAAVGTARIPQPLPAPALKSRIMEWWICTAAAAMMLMPASPNYS